MTTALNPIHEYLGHMLKIPDLKDPVNLAFKLDQFIRRPEELNPLIDWWVRIVGPKAYQSALSQLHLAERNKYIENEQRTLDLRQKERFLVCIERMMASEMPPFNMRTMFPYLQPSKVLPDGRWVYNLDKETPLRWIDVEHGNVSMGNGKGDHADGVTDPESALTRGSSGSQQLFIYQPRIFKPSHQSKNRDRVVSPRERQILTEAGVDPDSVRYQGFLGIEFLQNLSCPEDQNCSVYVTDISCHATLKVIFSAIFEGGIQKLSVQPPSRDHPAQAATIVFKESSAAKFFLARCQNPGISFYGQRIKATINRDKIKPLWPDQMHQSRVLIFTVHQKSNVQSLVQHIRNKGIVFDLVDVRDGLPSFYPGCKCVELSFASILGQSRQIMFCFQNFMAWEPGTPFFGCLVEYGLDPCDQSSGTSWNFHRLLQQDSATYMSVKFSENGERRV